MTHFGSRISVPAMSDKRLPAGKTRDCQPTALDWNGAHIIVCDIQILTLDLGSVLTCIGFHLFETCLHPNTANLRLLSLEQTHCLSFMLFNLWRKVLALGLKLLTSLVSTYATTFGLCFECHAAGKQPSAW